MRKLTGYIGAMIIVFALMGSILAGYALNINGTTAIINEYEPVTDVSGLYTHSEEKSYIDYNPASNYIGYQYGGGETYDNPTSTFHLQKINSGSIIYKTNDHIIINGVDQGVIPNYNASEKLYVVFDYGYLYLEPGPSLTLWLTDEPNITNITNDVKFWVNGNRVSVEITGVFTKTYTDVKNIMGYCTTNDYNYYAVRNNTINNVYANNPDQITIISYPYRGVATGELFRQMNTGNIYDVSGYYVGSLITENIYKYTTIGGTITGISNAWSIFYPKTVNNGLGPGIDYTDSARVNNYPISSFSSNFTTFKDVNLSNLTNVLTNYAPADMQRSNRTVIIGTTPDFTPEGNSLMTNIKWSWPCSYIVKNYLLSDILATENIPYSTYKIKIEFNSNSYSTFSGTLTTANINKNFDTNTACLNYNNWYVDSILNLDTPNNKIMDINNVYNEKEYAIYDPNTGIIDIYNYLGVKIGTRSAYNTYVTCMIHDTPVGAWKGLSWYRTANGSYYFNDYVQTSPNIYTGGNTNIVKLTYYQTSSTPVYMDITKGIKINPGNTYNVSWNNDYENGIVDIVFRSESIGNEYMNTIQTMNGDNIIISYTGSKFYIKVNDNENVEIGNWRNILLKIDFINNKVCAYPVKTFNSFTNVELYNTPIDIGEITDTIDTKLYWLPTDKSLMFSIYKTSVFMDTYGVVMVNPTLKITDYFTDLNDFYKIELSNFSMFGDSITINGETYPVSGNTITIGEESVIINDLSIVYADGNVYIEDSHVSIDVGEITDNTISMSGAWYFTTNLLRGYTAQKLIYDWDWSTFIFDNTQFCIFYIGIAIAGLLIARKYCNLSMIDYSIFIISIIIAVSVQVIA